MPPRRRYMRETPPNRYSIAFERFVQQGIMTVTQAIIELTTLPAKALRALVRARTRLGNRIRGPPRDWKLDVPRPPQLDVSEVDWPGFDQFLSNTWKYDHHVRYRDDDDAPYPTKYHFFHAGWNSNQ